MSVPSMRILPRTGSKKRSRRFAIVDFPTPLDPTRATTCPGFATKLAPLRTGSPGRYPNSTSSNTISPRNGGATRASGAYLISGSVSRIATTRSPETVDLESWMVRLASLSIGPNIRPM